MNANKPNILLITTDQQRFDTISALGNRDIYTPHLDWLTDEGITFTRAYSDCPVCMPARATIMTGKYAFNHGLTGNSNRILPLANNPTLPAILTQAGYQTRAQGKMHFYPVRANYGFEHMELPMDYYRTFNAKNFSKYPKAHGLGENEVTPVISTIHETQSLTHWTVRRSIDFLETRDPTRPFFLWTSFTKPHPPFDPCYNYWTLYANKKIDPPKYGDWSKDISKIPQGFLFSTYMLSNLHNLSEEQILNMRRAYYACITQIDYQLGLLFAKMRELNLLENTWIIFTSDHGEMLGDHHMAAKSVYLEGSAHIPFIIRPPARPWDPKPWGGKRVNTLVTLADVLPTILAITNIKSDHNFDGKNVLDENLKEREFIGELDNKYFCVMKNNFKYTWTSLGGGELLFDLNSDPYETKNLINSEQHKNILSDLKTILKKHIANHHPELINNDQLIPISEAPDRNSVIKWPGFHTFDVESDVLH